MSKIAVLNEVADELAVKRGMSKAQARDIAKDFIEIFASKVVEGGVSVKGVFTIKPKLQKGRTGTCSFNGKQWKTEDKYVLGITTGKGMEEELNLRK